MQPVQEQRARPTVPLQASTNSNWCEFKSSNHGALITLIDPTPTEYIYHNRNIITYRRGHALNSIEKLTQILHRNEEPGAITLAIVTHASPNSLKLGIGHQHEHHLKIFSIYSQQRGSHLNKQKIDLFRQIYLRLKIIMA